jgi:hypothetical protein
MARAARRGVARRNWTSRPGVMGLGRPDGARCSHGRIKNDLDTQPSRAEWPPNEPDSDEGTRSVRTRRIWSCETRCRTAKFVRRDEPTRSNETRIRPGQAEPAEPANRVGSRRRNTLSPIQRCRSCETRGRPANSDESTRINVTRITKRTPQREGKIRNGQAPRRKTPDEISRWPDRPRGRQGSRSGD